MPFQGCNKSLNVYVAPVNATSVVELQSFCASLGQEAQCCTINAVSGLCWRKNGDDVMCTYLSYS